MPKPATPDKTKIRTALTLRPALIRRLKQAAKMSGRTLNDIMTDGISDEVSRILAAFEEVTGRNPRHFNAGG